MNNTKCNNTNGTYACELNAGHVGDHQLIEIRRDNSNKISAYIMHHWSSAYSEVKTSKKFV